MMTHTRIEALALGALLAAGIDVAFMVWTELGLEARVRVEDYEARIGQSPRKLPRDDTRACFLRRREVDDEALVLGAPMSRVSKVTEIVLHRSVFRAMDEVDITEPAPFYYDRSGKWKSHPPSKRKRMRSWLRASPSERLRYAPLRGMDGVPTWWRHPDERRRITICRVVLWQEIGIFADPVLSAERIATEMLMARSNAARAALRTVRL